MFFPGEEGFLSQPPLNSCEHHLDSSFHPRRTRVTVPASAKLGSMVSEGTSQTTVLLKRWTLFLLGRKSSPHLLQLTTHLRRLIARPESTLVTEISLQAQTPFLASFWATGIVIKLRCVIIRLSSCDWEHVLFPA